MADDGSSGNDQFFFLGTGLFLAFMIFTKINEWISQNRIHQIIAVAICGSLFFAISYWVLCKYEKILEARRLEEQILGPADNAVYCGETKDGKDVFVKTAQRTMHSQVIGTTNAGKTESVILPWAIQDIEQGRGLILIDGKSDKSLLDKLWSYAVKNNRAADFRLFSLSNIAESYQFNPLIGGTAEEISERIFNAFEFENLYYRSIQFEVFSQVMRCFERMKRIPTFLRLHQTIANPLMLKTLVRDLVDSDPLKQWADYYADLPPLERAQRTSGLLAAISHFAFGKTACLFEAENPSINIDEALAKNQIIYFQLPVMLSPFLGQATGKMILQSLQAAVANRHRSTERNPKFYSVFLDDFTEYLYPGFVTILNKSRSANVGVVFAHQALGDIQTLGEAIANSILTNANIKIFMRGNDPDSTEYFARVIGTEKSMKYTERTTTKLFSEKAATGEASAREVDEFITHPNIFKKELGVGEAMMVLPHPKGSKTIQIKFRKYPDLPAQPLAAIDKTLAAPIEISKEIPAEKSEIKKLKGDKPI